MPYGFKTKAKSAGYCKNEAKHTWEIGDDIYMWNSGSKDNPNWGPICCNLECFEKNGGKITTGGGGQPSKRLSPGDAAARCAEFSMMSIPQAKKAAEDSAKVLGCDNELEFKKKAFLEFIRAYSEIWS